MHKYKYVYINISTYVREYMYEGAEERQGFICFSLPLCVCVPCVIIYYKKLFTRLGGGDVIERRKGREY